MQSNDYQLQGIQRTICIGLGGTGRDVLMRLRRLIVEQYGDLTKLPVVSFVHIDTDKTATQGSSLKTGNTYRGVDLSFRDSEKINAILTAAEVTNFVQGVEQRSSYDRQGPYDHISRWFPPQLLRNIRAVEEGAKGIRPVGRLAFFHNYQKIRTAIETAERRTMGHEAILLKSGLKVDPGLNIFVVGSLCGGTGSGMFLDIAYSLRKLYGDKGTQLLGYLVISPQLYSNASYMNANTYAALKELNHYSSPGTRFEACYDMQNLVLVQEPRAPFDYTYLVSNQTNGEYTILEQQKLCNVIAHKIALDFLGELAPVAKGMRDNLLTHLIQSDNHPRPNPQGYLTFGLAAIYFPREIIVKIALNRISLKLLNFWLNGEGQSPDPQLILEQFMIKYKWHSDSTQRDGFTERLTESVQEGNQSFTNTLTKWRNNLINNKINECKNRENRLELQTDLSWQFRSQFRKVQPGENETTRGIWLTRLLQISPVITKQLKDHINEFIAELMTPSNPNFSIKTVRDWLDAMETDLNSYQHQLEEEISQAGGMKKIEDMENKWRDIQREIDDIEEKIELPLFNGKNRNIQKKAESAVRKIFKLIEDNFKLTATQEALNIVGDLQKCIRDFSVQTAGFSRVIENWKTDYEKEQKDLNNSNFNEMSGEAIFAQEDIKECYQILLPDINSRSQLVLVSKDITEASGVEESLSYLMNRSTLEQLKTEINQEIDIVFGSRSNQIVKSVIKRFIQNYSASVRPIRLGQIIQEAEPLLRLNSSDPYFSNLPDKLKQFIGFKDTDELEVKQFKSILNDDLGIDSTILKPSQAEDQILIVKEYGGFPLRLINGLEEIRNHYIREQNRDGSSCHSDYQIQFTDIIPPDAHLIEKLADVFYPCLAFELIFLNPETQVLQLEYYDDLRRCYYTAKLSPVWNQSLEELANNQEMTATLKQLLEDVISQIRQNSNLWENNYLLKLQKFVDYVDKLPESSPNYSCKSTVVGARGTIVKQGVINRLIQRIKGEIQNTLPLSVNDNLTARGDLIVNRGDSLERELKQLQKGLDQGNFNQKEYEVKRKEIMDKYGLS
ncbi:tubulin-like doman-containing protein [Planktothrix agardhii]|uniref:tubulin-like doman-containing protein n=1 Tax=Planktothrix agardhii TaxID=1160 RepID=UPI001F469076|nr:tubulin-like doman-containing protein [Planktothrix agardhii]MCF3575543.1 tubulin-like doman-containing protein [Planktothrix agardhii 1812]MCF3580635.1 tubulin-like doman-containing protein [Planktothrix agardhii 1811]